MKKIIVASRNPVKVNAFRIGFEKMFPEVPFEIEGIAVPSGVSDQPMTDEETRTGAWNRASNAQTQNPYVDYWVGIEGGIEEVNNQMIAFAWVVVRSKNQEGEAKTGAFFLPPRVAELIREGMELGAADDIVFGDNNSKQKGGAVGLLTNNVIDRTQLYVGAVVMALIPFKNKNLYSSYADPQK